MKNQIVYGSCYGTTKKYAEELSKRTGFPAVSYQDAPDLSDCDILIYLGGLYAGGILGLAQTLKRLPAAYTGALVLVTVGLADTAIQTNVDSIVQSAQKALPAALLSRTKLFHLRGGIDYKQLSFKHRIMMKMVYMLDKKLPPEKQTDESREMVATYGQKVDFVNVDRLDEIIAAL